MNLRKILKKIASVFASKDNLRKVQMLITFDVCSKNKWTDKIWYSVVEEDMIELWEDGDFPGVSQIKVENFKYDQVRQKSQ